MNTANFNLDVVVAAIVGFIIGALLVWIISYLSRKKDKEEDDATRQELQALQKEYNQYRARVNEHFAKTADSIDGLTKSYQQVFDHLSHGAQNLMDSEALQAQLEKRQNKAVTLAYLVEQERKTKQGAQPSAGTAAQPTAKPASAPQSDAVAAKKQPTTSAEGVKKTATADKAIPPKSNVHIAAEKAGLKPIARADKQAPVKQPEAQGKAAVAKQAEAQEGKPAAVKQPEVQSKPAAAKQPEAQSKAAAPQQPEPQSKPAPAKQPTPPSKPESKIIQDEPHETAIEAVKKHIKEDADKGGSK